MVVTLSLKEAVLFEGWRYVQTPTYPWSEWPNASEYVCLPMTRTGMVGQLCLQRLQRWPTKP